MCSCWRTWFQVHCGGVLDLFYGKASLVVLLYFDNSFANGFVEAVGEVYLKKVLYPQQVFSFSVRLVFVVGF